MEMVTRVARAIAAVAWGEEECWVDCLDEARAAIEAMRTPTVEMIDAIENAPSTTEYSDPLLAWPIMIDAALSPRHDLDDIDHPV